MALLRIALAVSLAVLGGAAVIRQPSLREVPYTHALRANPEALRQHVAFLTSRSRSADDPRSLEEAAVYIERAFRASGARVESQPFTARTKRYRNVIARFGPETGAAMIVGAHYDAFSSLPGADDNASGTAGLLELARLLGRTTLKTPVTLVAYTTEEPPFFGSDEMGSAVHASSLTRSNTNVAGMICLEMIGYYADQQTWPNKVFALLYPSRGDFIAVGGGWDDRKLTRHVKRAIRGAGGVPVYSFTGARMTLDASDQRNYWSAGWPAVLVTDTAFLRNPYYHTAEDTVEKLDYVKMSRVVDGVCNAVMK